MVACGNRVTNQGKISNDTSKNKVEIQLRGKVKPEQLVGAFQKYEFKALESINKENNTWLFSFNNDKISAEEVVRMMKDSQFANSAKTVSKKQIP